MKNLYSWCVAMMLVVVATTASALPDTFSIDQIYSNADGTVQFVVIRDTGRNDCDAGEANWAGLALVSTGPGPQFAFTFPANLPSCKTSGRRILIATGGFAALGLVSPDYVIPNGFLQIPNGTVNFAGVSEVTYAALPNDGVKAIDASGTPIQNVATNLAGASASVVPVYDPVSGLWCNCIEPGTGYSMNVRHGVLVVTVFSYLSTGQPLWYLVSGPIVNNVFTGTLDKYQDGQCISCAYKPAILNGNDGLMKITFTSNTTATMELPSRAPFPITPLAF